MRRIIAIFKNSLHTINAIVAISVIAIYLLTHFNLSGYIAKNAITDDLAKYIGTEVSLDNAEVDILNQFVLDNLLIRDQQNDTLLYARRVLVSFDILPLLQKELEIHTVQLVDFDIHLSKRDSLTDTNFQFLVDKFMPKDKDNRRKVLDDILVNSIILRSGHLTYEDWSKEARQEYLDIHHLDFDDISANMKIMSSKENGLFFKLKRLSLKEQSGMNITKASAVIQLDEDGRRLDFNDVRLTGKQKISTNHIADFSLVGFAAMENKRLNAEVISFNVNMPEMVDMAASFKAENLLEAKERIGFNIALDHFNATQDAVKFFANRYAGETARKFAKYINNVYELDCAGEAEGSLDDFSYKMNAECFGELSSVIFLDGHYQKDTPLSCDIDAKVNNLEVKKHFYKEIAAKGKIDDECFSGAIRILDPLCTGFAKGRFFYKKNRVKLNAEATIENIEPFLLNLTDIKNFEGVNLSGKILADVSLKNFKQPLGEILIDSLRIEREEMRATVPVIAVNAQKDKEKYVANLNSNIATAAYEAENGREKIAGEIKKTRTLSEIFRLPVSITRDASIEMELDSLRRIVLSEISLPEVEYDGAQLSVEVNSHQETDTLRHTLSFDYKKDENHIASTLRASSLFDPLFIDIKPAKVVFNNDEMDCGGATVRKLEDKTYDLQRFSLRHKNQLVKAQGKIAGDGASDLKIHIENLGIDTLCSFLSSNYLKFGGVGTGDIFYKSDSSRQIKSENLFVKDFSYLGGKLGDTRLNANFDVDKNRFDLIADVHSKEDSITRISGYIQIAKKDSLDLKIEANRLNLDFLKYWVGGFIEELEGNLSGDVHLHGLARELKLEGEPFVDASFTNHLSGSRFFLRDKISLTKDKASDYGHFTLNNARIYDSFDHLAHVNASIRHKFLRQYNYDVRVDFPDDNTGFLLFDKPTHYNNELYWGQLYTSGSCMLRGGDGRHRIDVSCKTVGKSNFNLSPNEESYSENGYNFLTFRDKNEFEASERGDYSETGFLFAKEEEEESSTYIEFDLQAEATENCQVYVQMDPLAEDRLICRGTGNISLHYDPQHDITIGGVYNITQGNYLVTMRGDLINKEFKIQNGSRVLFPGTFSGAELDIDAVYSIPSVNLRDLDESFATMASMNRTTLPVDCKLEVTGQLSAPQIAFDLEVKNTSDDVQALVHNLIGTQEMLNREVFYLLLFSKFYTPEYASTSQNNNASELTSFTSASLTSQLNNLLGHISDNFTLGTNFRSDKGDFSDMEMDLSLSTRLFSDRLILNGNLGYRDPANRVGFNNNNNSFIGDFDVEYLFNASGTLRAKAYSHYNERDYSINNALTTQGIGFVVRKDFKSLKELLFWKNLKGKK